ncbi:substrate-binding domain-containing protein, partial [Herbaspirillum sp. B65]|uniref:substrate-binding domain-containing protein n=1 Tax=Herbaspirillum sp. B65 TaxID=137708 RepID=UPI0005C8EDD5
RQLTAIFASNDLPALGAMNAIADLGLSVPRDISVIGAHSAIGLLAGGVSGALGAGASSALMPDIAEQIKKLGLPAEVESAVSLAAAAGV